MPPYFIFLAIGGHAQAVHRYRWRDLVRVDRRDDEIATRAWRYRPYTVNGTPMPVCGVVTFVYTIR